VKKQQWYFGGVDRNTGKCFIVPVKQRNAETLLPLIQKFIAPGSIIISDCWAAYNKINELPEIYKHYTVNHSENFVDPTSKEHTNTIESTWQKFKHGHKKRYGTHRTTILSYVHEFLWRKEFEGTDVFFHFWSQISQLYPI
jgi:transposase-like protein